ncbi:GNAT family N-acetyltransferase [Bradyrhizobium zhanjiangense]|uniref:GNAT family N-acetyltransferase n=1 Tax=Bradyrhizobium zhanjiangense TaxID=1325107 RepID=UPI001008A48E|nr:GNAT family N-acetyltransferase [Bradyrhizobium zhanjiangense]
MVITRKVSIDDATMVTHMVESLFAELGAGQSQAGVKTELVADLLAMNECVYGYLAFLDERPVGILMVSGSASLSARGTYGIITELYVVPDQRSSGVAMRLIEGAVSLGVEKGWVQLEVGTPKQPMWNRSPNSALYLKAGFAEIGPRLMFTLRRLVGPREHTTARARSRLGSELASLGHGC